MNTLSRILSLWLALAFLASGTYAQNLSGAEFLPEGIMATDDTTEVRALTEWATEHLNSQPEQARQIAERALTLARQLNDQRGIATSMMLLGNLASDTHLQEGYYTEAREIYERIGDERGLIRSWLNLGSVYRRQGQLEIALIFSFDALTGLERLGDTQGQTVVLNNIGNVHKELGNFEDALTYYERAVALAETLGDPVLYAYMLSNLGNTHAKQGSYETAELILRQALAISEPEGIRYQMVTISNNLGYVLNAQGHYEQALAYLYTAESLAQELEEDLLLSAVYEELGKAYLGLMRFDSALLFATESLVLAQKIGVLSRQMGIHQTLSEIYKATGNYEQALIHYEGYMSARDSVFTAEKAEIIAQMQTRYETEEKQRAIERLEQENRIRVLQLMLSLAAVVVALLIAALFYNRYRIKQKANSLLEELDVAKSRFFANISHEFRTPLTVILGGLQDTISGRFGNVSEKVVNQQHVMLHNTRRLQGLINEVLDLNRLESGQLELRPAPGDLTQSLKYIVEANAPLAERNGITLTLVCDAETCLRLYDEEKLDKIVGNLLSNALKFTPRGGSVRVGLRCKDRIEISVTDDGPGIPTEVQSNVFERFTQLDHGVLKGGTGIGLALAKELTELHGGTITLESTPGEGSTFTVRLPLKRSTVTAVQQEKIEQLELGGDGHTNSPFLQWEHNPEGETDRTTVLIIEDNNDVRAYIRRSLEETYRVLEATDGERGLQQARTELPDLIVSDVMLPGIDGYGIARCLKAEPATECIPLIMLTARAAEEDQTEGYGAGAEVYITKPFAPETLHAAVTRLLEERRRLRWRLQERARMEDEQKNIHSTLRDRVRATVLEHLHDEKFGVEELASLMSMSRHTLYRHVKEETGSSPIDFVRGLRLECARELLTNGAGSVSEIAYAVGFKSLSHFTRSFRKHFGRSPSSILEEQKG